MDPRDDFENGTTLEDSFPLPDSDSITLGSHNDSPFLNLGDESIPLETDNWTLTELVEKPCHNYFDEDISYLASGQVENAKGKCNKSRVELIQHKGLVLKSPVAYKRDTDRSILPIQPNGMAVCKRCGAMGVKHAFYTKEREFCSVLCAQKYTLMCKKGKPVAVPMPVLNFPLKKCKKNETKQFGKNTKLKHEVLLKKVESVSSQSVKKLRRKNNNTPSDSYDWKSALRSPKFFAAPVTCFRHAPGAACWEDVTGRKVEVENTDCDDSSVFPNTFWVATVLRVCGYFVQLRYEGFEQNSSKDFWLNLCSPDVHSVGWCAMRGNPLIPPKTIEHKQSDWKGYLHKQLTGEETLSLNFYSKIMASRECKFKPGMNVELVDKVNISRVKMATVSRVTGKRLILKYYDSDDDIHGFHCHEDSPLLHPVGWAKEVGAQIDAPRDYCLRCETEDYDENDATKELFTDSNFSLTIPDLNADNGFKVGMKLEAIDPLNLSTICVGTIMEVLRFGYLMIRIDSYDEDPTNSDWFCYHSSSPCIFPAGFCDSHDIPLTPPKSYRLGKFEWSEYLKRTKFETVPSPLFNRVVPDHGFKVGMRLEAADLMDPRLVCGASISRIVDRLLKVHFDGWEDEYDQWLDCESPDIYPVGWCNLVGHKLEKPGPPGATYAAAPKQVLKPLKKVRRRSKKGKVSPENATGRRVLSTTSPAVTRDRPDRVLRKLQPKQIYTEKKINDSTQSSAPQLRGRRALRKVVPQQSNKSGWLTLDVQVPESNNNSSPNEDVPDPEPCGLSPKQKIKSPVDEGIMEVEEEEKEQIKPLSSVPKKPVKSNELTLTPPVTAAVTSMAGGEILTSNLDTNGSNVERSELTPDQWSVLEVADFLIANDCKTYSNNFISEEVNGKALLSLTKDEVMELADMKVGPSLKIQALIEQLKAKVNPGRQKTFIVKILPKLHPEK